MHEASCRELPLKVTTRSLGNLGQGEILISQEISWGSKMASPFFLSYVLVNNNKKILLSKKLCWVSNAWCFSPVWRMNELISLGKRGFNQQHPASDPEKFLTVFLGFSCSP